MTITQHDSSFRDPCGFVFFADGILYRRVNAVYRDDYNRLMGSGLYDRLAADGLLVRHQEAQLEVAATQGAFKVLRPEVIPFVSYPYSWCFGQLKAAALATIEIQKRALEAGMWLKDASAYNIQFVGWRPVLVDTLSFERCEEGRPWPAYRQFCQHFLAPLALMGLRDGRLAAMLRLHVDGLPLDLADALLPLRAHFRPGLFLHLHLHSRIQSKYRNRPVSPSGRRFSHNALMGLAESLANAVSGLKCAKLDSDWAGYYGRTSYTDAAMRAKAAVIDSMLAEAAPGVVWDFGANTGYFSRIAAKRASYVVAFEMDRAAVEANYAQCLLDRESSLLPLVMDLANPSPALGWSCKERASLIERGPADLVMALALVHHLAIGNNVPLPMLADFFARTGRSLIVEFVPKSDPMVQRLLATRRDIFDDYTQAGFESAFADRFRTHSRVRLDESERVLYLMRAK